VIYDLRTAGDPVRLTSARAARGGRSASGARGFSLLELVIVLSLASILAGIGVLSHRAMRPALDLSAAARQVVMGLKVARMRAAAENVNHRIVFSAGAGSYQAQRKGGSGYANIGAPIPLPRGIVVVDCNANGSAIGFRPRGNAATFGTVTIGNDQGDVRLVIVDIAGQVRVQ
jgi:prepilin-type N-terminal cleavage/methylation domain-containing protein